MYLVVRIRLFSDVVFSFMEQKPADQKLSQTLDKRDFFDETEFPNQTRCLI